MKISEPDQEVTQDGGTYKLLYNRILDWYTYIYNKLSKQLVCDLHLKVTERFGSCTERNFRPFSSTQVSRKFM